MHKKWFFLMFLAFFILPSLKYIGGFAFLILPFVFFWLFAGSHHNSEGWGWCMPGHDEEGKLKEKPKRNYVETVDGEFLEVIDEPKRA